MEKLRWYACKRDIGITVALMLAAFITWPFLIKGWRDYWLFEIEYVVLLVFIETLLICRKHFWTWTAIATYSIAFFIKLDISPHLPYLLMDNMKTAAFVAMINSLYSLVFILPIAAFTFNSRKRTTRISPYLLLWPIGWVAGMDFKGFSSYKPDELAVISFAMDLAVYLAVISVIIFFLAVYFYDRTMDNKKRVFLKWLSIVSWIPAGLVPGIVSLGWEYSLYATVLPVVTIYYFFKLSQGDVISHQDNRIDFKNDDDQINN